MKAKITGLLLIIAIAVLSVTGLLLQDPISQDISYHSFSDTRELFSISNFWNVVSNLPFLIVGIIGLYKTTKAKKLNIIANFKIAYILLYMGVTLVAFGSGYYHLWPDNQTLVWDRLPMTIAFTALFSVIISEFISIAAGRALLLPFIFTGIASVVYWHISESRGAGDLRFYAFVQFFPLLVIPVILTCFRSPYNNVNAYWLLLTTYIAAKAFEHFDYEIYNASEFISGHTLKHVAAALGLYILLVSYERRSYTR